VPTNEDLVVSVEVTPADIGQLQPGSRAQLRFEAYDFEQFGTLAGSVDQISAASFVANNGELYYTAQISPERSFVGELSEGMSIQPGMSVDAHIITGRRTVMEYILSPFLNAIRPAMTES
jgi:adhesin transport system membrane fusion protein